MKNEWLYRKLKGYKMIMLKKHIINEECFLCEIIVIDVIYYELRRILRVLKGKIFLSIKVIYIQSFRQREKHW